MTSREKFEEVISASPYEKSVARWPSDSTKHAWPGNYKDVNVDLAWCMWQASCKQAMEEAATEAASWKGGKLLLNAGELTLQEKRSCVAVALGISAAINLLGTPKDAF